VTLRERILKVYRREMPDVVPYMLDLSHWFYHRFRQPWDLSAAYTEPESDLIGYHRRNGVGFYIANNAAFVTASYPPDVVARTEKMTVNGAPEIVWRLTTPLGTIERRRRWNEQTYSWGITQWGIQTEHDLKVFAYAMSHRTFAPDWENYRAWAECVGNCGVLYISTGYSAMGHLLHYWMGIEQTMYATVDWGDALREAVDSVNANLLEQVDLIATSPAEVVLMGDNFSSDVQPPHFFDTWSRDFYVEAIRRLHAAGKFVAVHIDGRLRGAIRMVREVGADCGDAITPSPIGDLTPLECREEAGPDFILSGGVAPCLWLPETPIETFKAKVIEWLELRRRSPALIANAGDQVPPGAEEARIHLMRDLVERYGRY